MMTAHDNFLSAKRFGSLDALRCFAIIGVIWQHCPPIPHDLSPFTDFGASGVSLFFVISGFLITTLLLREESSTGSINLRNFYVRRSLRIFPLYYSVLTLYTVIIIFFEDNAAGRLFISNLPYFLTYTSNWFVDLIINEDGQRRVIFIFAWSLATEEQFYLFWPAVLLFMHRQNAIRFLVGILLVDIILTFTFGKPEIPLNNFDRLLKIAISPSTEIFCGVLLAISLHTNTSFFNIYKFLGSKNSAFWSMLFTICVLLWPGRATPGWYSIQALAFTFFIGSCVIREDHGLARLLKLKILTRIGTISYGMYMLHMLSINVVRKGMHHFSIDNSWIFLFIAFLLTVFTAEISWRFFESPILKYKKRFKADGDLFSKMRTIC